jgi:hypothetical protein
MMAASRGAKVVRLPKGASGSVGGFTEEELKAEELANVVHMITVAVDTGCDEQSPLLGARLRRASAAPAFASAQP